MQSSRFLALVGGLLFVAVCAYFICGLYSAMESVETVSVSPATIRESAELNGIAVRTEQLLASSRYVTVCAADGERLPSGALLAKNEASSLTAPCSAIYFSDFDGLEYLSAESCADMTVPALEKLMDSVPSSVGSAFGRLVTDYVWYFAALADSGSPIPDHGCCTVLFDGFDGGVDAEIVSLSAQEGGKRAVLLRLTCGGDYLKLRRTRAELIFSQHTGLALPPAAVRHDENGDYVYTVSGGLAVRKNVDITYRTRELCLAAAKFSSDGLCSGNIVVTSGENIYEGCVIEK